MFIRRGKKIKKAQSIEVITLAIQNGKLKPSDEISDDGKAWIYLSKHPELQNAFGKKSISSPFPIPLQSLPSSHEEVADISKKPVEYSSRFRRFFAFIVDFFLVYIVMEILKQIWPWLKTLNSSEAWIAHACIGLIYFSIFESSVGGGVTAGKKIMSIYLVRNSGGTLSIPPAFLKSLLFFTSMVSISIKNSFYREFDGNSLIDFGMTLSAFCIFMVLFIGNLGFILFHPQRRSLYDVFCSCSVMHSGQRNEEPVNFTRGSIIVPLICMLGVLALGGYGFYKKGFTKYFQNTSANSEQDHNSKRRGYHIKRMATLDGPGWTNLHRAAVRGNLKEVRKLVENGADVNALGDDGNAVLKEVARRGKVRVMQYLLNRGAKVDIRDNVEFTPLHIAAEYHQIEAIELLLKWGSDINAQNIIGMTALRQAASQAWHGDGMVAEVLLKHRADMTIRSNEGCIPVYCATNSHHYPFVESLLKHGADPNSKSGKGFPILYAAVFHQETQMVKLILKYKADPNLTNKTTGSSPLHIAVNKKNMELIRLLLESKANPNQMDFKGNTPLHKTVQRGSDAMNRLLFEKGADPYQVNSQGETPYSIAKNLGRRTLLEWFSKYKTKKPN